MEIIFSILVTAGCGNVEITVFQHTPCRYLPGIFALVVATTPVILQVLHHNNEYLLAITIVINDHINVNVIPRVLFIGIRIP